MTLLRAVCVLALAVSADTLLCHDDKLEGRRLAFVFYLVTEWSQSDGGEYFNTFPLEFWTQKPKPP